MGQLAAFHLRMLKEMFVSGSETKHSALSPSKGQNWPLFSEEGDRKVHIPSTPRGQDGRDKASTIPLQHLFLFAEWASTARERDQTSEACSPSLKLTA